MLRDEFVSVASCSPLVSGAGPLSDCSLCLLHGLPNHSYVDLTLVGNDGTDGTGNTVRCITDLGTCCGTAQGVHRGHWYFPDGSELVHGGDIDRARGDMRFNLRRRNNAMGPSGIYRCDIPTDAVHDDSDLSVRETVYVGLYASGGNILHKSHSYDIKLLSRRYHHIW